MFDKLAPLSLLDRDPPGGIRNLPTKLWPFIWFFVRQVKLPLLLMCVLFASARAVEALEPWFLGRFIDALTNLHEQRDQMWATLGGLVVTYIFFIQIVMRVVFQVGHIIEAKIMPLFVMMIRRQLAVYMYGHSYRYFQDDFAGRLGGKVIEMPDAIRATVGDITTPFLFSVTGFVTAIVLFATVGWIFALISGVYFATVCLLMYLTATRTRQPGYEMAEAMHVVRGSFIDSISNMFLIKSFARQQHENDRLRETLEVATLKDRAEQMTIVWLWRWIHITNATFQISLLAVCLLGWRDGWVSTGTVAMALPLSFQLVMNSWWLLDTCSRFFVRLGEIQNGIDTIVQAHEVTDKPKAAALKISKGEINIENLTFAYPARPVFENLTLRIPAYQRVGLVGPSGAGKSTLVQLLLRLADVQGGAIAIDGQNIADVTQNSLREQIAMIPQSTELLHRSISDNIRFGRLDATEDEIRTAAKLAFADDFIQTLKDKDGNEGYGAQVGERGVKLSGGQRQRIALARAILKDAPILLLDEATSALDSESERLIQQSLGELMKNRTVVVIAHRLSTILHLDRLIVLDQGRIVEDGSHQELLSRGGLYARLWSMQSEGFLGGTKRKEQD